MRRSGGCQTLIASRAEIRNADPWVADDPDLV